MHKQKSVDKRPITFWLVMTSEDRTEQQQQQHQALSDHHHHHHHRHHHLNYCLHYIRHNITRTELALLHHSTPEANSHFGDDKTHTQHKLQWGGNKKMSVAAADQISSNIDKWCLLRQQHNYKAKNCRKLEKLTTKQCSVSSWKSNESKIRKGKKLWACPRQFKVPVSQW